MEDEYTRVTDELGVVLGPTWTTRDGRVIPVKWMSNSHLMNTVRYILRFADSIFETQACSVAPPDNEDGYFEYVESQLTLSNKEIATRHIPIFKYLVRECKKRKLDYPKDEYDV